MCSVLQVHSLSLCSHLQVNISDPFDDPMRGPYQWIHVLVFTLYSASLQCLKANRTPFTQLGTCIPSAYKYAHIIVAYCNLRVGVVRLLTYFLVEIE